jgi:hypothetical protein
MITRTANVRFTIEGFHRWPDAPAGRAYLRMSHRHLFYIQATVEVMHNEREIEYHDLLDFCKAGFMVGVSGDLGPASCETMAEDLVNGIVEKWPGRFVEVSVFEDNEVGAKITYVPDQKTV